MTDFITADEAATLLKVKKRWIYEKTRTGQIPFYKLGKFLRFNPAELRDYFREFGGDGRNLRSQKSKPKKDEG